MAESARYLRPGTFIRRVVNPVVVRLGLGTLLVVRGRTSGNEIRVPLGAPIELDGVRYFVSGRGQTHWVRNLRAAGCAELRRGRRREQIGVVELDGAERERVVAAYRAKLGRSVEPLFRALPDPADHPVFRIEPLA